MYIQSAAQSSLKIRSSTSANFYLPISLPYFFAKPSLMFPTSLLSSITQQFLSSQFLHTAIPTISSESFFFTLNIEPIQAASRDQWASEFCEEDCHCFNLFLILRSMDRDNVTNNYWFLIAQAQKIGVLQVVLSEEND